MRFVLGPLGTDGADGSEYVNELVALSTAAEANGFDAVVLSEARLPEDDGWAAGFTLAIRLAAHTTAIRLGVQIPADVTNPIYHAEEAAVLDAVSNGRAMVLVRRATQRESATIGDEGGEPSTRFADAVEVLLRSWHPNSFSIATANYRYPAKSPSNDFAAGINEINVTPNPTQLAMPAWLVVNSQADLDLCRRLDLPPAFAPGVTPASPLSISRPAIVVRDVVLADTDADAWEQALPILNRRHGRRDEASAEGWRDVAVVGSVDSVVDQIAVLERAGVGIVACRPLWPSTDIHSAIQMIRFFGAAIVPEFRMFGFPTEIRLHTAAEAGA